ncbi:uncharacterized protein LOC122078794 [Macadamia integrifolia]|uniref:uncharacterized protein LOC122078794 n=1 Tax=Macadamia integrifolia TaxID=60698 RepID=UPI001C4FF685|nr:uncharacterized protein LOC122078794 [Macadamia integrifolia]
MAFEEGPQTLSLKVYIDKEKNRVVMAEADGDFVDILLSFLTMPMGTIVRLLNKQPQPVTIGSLTTLYKWVEQELEEQFLQTEACKSMLLHPRNPNEKVCSKLKLNIDDKEPTKYYICADWNCSRGICNGGSGRFYSTFKTVRCSCGKMMDKETCMEKLDHEAAGSVGDGGVFVCGTTKFMVTDDLQVKSISPATIVTLLYKVGIKDERSLQETTLNIGSEEILNLLKRSLFSKTPLTDVFLRKQGFTSEALNFEIADAVQSKSSGITSFTFPEYMCMKLMMSSPG